jgi:hypothetical protein
MDKDTKKTLICISILVIAIILFCTVRSCINRSLDLDFHNCKMKEMCMVRDGVAHYKCVDCDSI